MKDAVGPASITAAALVMQFFLSVIISIGAFWIRRKEAKVFRFYEDPPNIGRYAWILLLFALATIGLLVFSDQFTDFWKPLSGEMNFSIITWRMAVLDVFLLDILCVGILVQLTAGSYASPFTPVYFILPAMAFFLRESPRRVILYTVLVVLLFICGFTAAKPRPDEADHQKGAYAFVSISCLMLSVVIGYLTRAR